MYCVYVTDDEIALLLQRITVHEDFPYRHDAKFVLDANCIRFQAFWGEPPRFTNSDAFLEERTEKGVLKAALTAMQGMANHEGAECFLLDGQKRFDPHRFVRARVGAPVTVAREEFITLPVYGPTHPDHVDEGDRWIRRASTGRGWELCEATDGHIVAHPMKIGA